ncbi:MULTISPECIES: hypothetical protein [unclassified Mesorhizobium]|uniref:hypothetical protein n=1 Tax=unclassified Mesorhizobium TaxID=325217 RepID=UPI0033383524
MIGGDDDYDQRDEHVNHADGADVADDDDADHASLTLPNYSACDHADHRVIMSGGGPWSGA